MSEAVAFSLTQGFRYRMGRMEITGKQRNQEAMKFTSKIMGKHTFRRCKHYINAKCPKWDNYIMITEGHDLR